MKQIRNTFVRLVLFCVCGFFFLSNYAQSYQDDFDELREKNWEHWGKYAIWKTEDGFLKVWINSPPSPRGKAKPTIELLQFKDVNGELIQKQLNNPGYESYTITVRNITGLGIVLGRLMPDPGGNYPFYYLFFPNISYSARFGSGFVAIGKSTGRLPLNPDTIWRNITELESMTIRFNKGHIQWYADGEKRADFKDPDFITTEVLGFVIIGSGIRAGHGWVDSFEIKSTLAVSPQAKLATTWGKLKQRE